MIAMPSYGQVAVECARSLAMMMHYIGHLKPDGLEWVGIQNQSSSNLPELRHMLVVNAIRDHQATHILWVDSDMGFPRDSFHRLLAHGLEVVGCNYPRRHGRHFSSASDLAGNPVKPGATGLEQVSTIGFGLILTRSSVFEDDYELPLFGHHDEHGYCTEDVMFCRKAIAAGHEIWVDHDLSREIRHIGSVSLGHEHMMESTV